MYIVVIIVLSVQQYPSKMQKAILIKRISGLHSHMEDIWELWWVAVLVECTKQPFHKLLSQIGDTMVSVLVPSAKLMTAAL